MPTCDCEICEEAREKGVPYSRSGNSIFIHDQNILIDTPERIWDSLNRENIEKVDYIFISHFHADHVLGLRVLQPLGLEEIPVENFVGEDKPTLVMSQQTYDRVVDGNEVFQAITGNWADVEILNDGETMEIGDLEVKSIGAELEKGNGKEVFGFLLTEDDKTAFISPDENRHFKLDRLPKLDLWIKETGYFEETPDGRLLRTEKAEETTLKHEMKFEESLEQIRQVKPERVVMTEIEELFRRSYDDYKELEKKYPALNLEFAYDGMKINL
ncbi:MAG: MBL fold metallo-hydrolase [Candidatus Nanohaloarchaea archaeon]